MKPKTSHLQIRVSPEQKRVLHLFAKRANMDMSEWVLTKIFPSKKEEWASLLKRFVRSREPKFVLAEMNDYLTSLSRDEFPEAVEKSIPQSLDPYWSNYLAAMVECAAHQKEVSPPSWVTDIPPLNQPVFATKLKSLQFYLLLHTPPPFRNRNLFIDTTVGGRV